jgi:glycosyltransferase involved in cell wall biosynthesis
MVSLPDASPPELSVIVPFLNEGEMLPSLIQTLQRQQGVKFELILCDGGSEDDSHDVLSPLLATFPYEYRLYHSPPGSCPPTQLRCRQQSR